MEREGEEEHEGAEGRVGLKVHVDVVAAALQVGAASVAVAVAVPVVRDEGSPLLPSPPHLPTVLHDPLQDEDHEEAGGHDELCEGETGLFETDREMNQSKTL